MPKPGISLSAYARHRKERGLSGSRLSAVQEARDRGRLGGAFADGRILNAEAADAAWAASTNADMVPGSGPTAPAAAHAAAPSPLSEHRARHAAATATVAELELAEKRGELISLVDVESYWADIVTLVRTKLLGIPARARLRDPTLTAKQVQTVDALVREALEELARDAAR